jgi:DNA-binding GntR family transcriptional regulator
MNAAVSAPLADPFDELRGEITASRTLSAEVANRLGRLITEARLEPGTPLRLQAIADRMGVSVQPVREALRMLAAEGLVTIEPHRGAFVNGLSIEEVEELYAVRMGLESLAARIGVTRLTDGVRADLEQGFDAMVHAESHDDQAAFMAADRAFHLRLYEAASRPRLLGRILDLWDASTRAKPLVYEGWLPIGDALTDHRPLLNAVRADDPEAAEMATRAHLEGAARRVLTALQEQE